MRCILFFLVFSLLFGSAAYSVTMQEAVELALRNNPELRVLRGEQGIALGVLEKARLPLIANPTLGMDLSRKGTSPTDTGGPYRDYGLILSQEFEVAGQRGLRINIAEKGLSATALEIRDKERLVSYDVKDAFARSLAAKKRGELTREVVRLKSQLLDFTKIKFQAGEVSALEVNLAEVELSKTKRELLFAEREYRETLLALQRVIGVPPATDFNIAGEILIEDAPVPDKESLKRFARTQRPDVRAALIQIDRAKASLALVHRTVTPNILLSGFYSRDEERNVAGVMVSVPLPLIDRKQAEKRIALTRSEQAQVYYAGLEKIVDNEVERVFNDFTSAREEVSLFKKEILSKIMENLSLLNLAFKEGKISFFEIRVAQKDTIDAQFAYLDAQYRTQLAINAIESVVGGDYQ